MSKGLSIERESDIELSMGKNSVGEIYTYDA